MSGDPGVPLLDLVDLGPRSLDAYRGVAPDDLLDSVRVAAAPLRGARVLHVNATPYGGGVSELLRSVVPLLRDLGLVAHWRIISGDDAFFRTTKAMRWSSAPSTAARCTWPIPRVPPPVGDERRAGVTL